MATVTATFTDALGVPNIGYVEFKPASLRPSRLHVGSILTPTEVRADLDENGDVEVELEPGVYSVKLVFQWTRNVYTTVTVPDADAPVRLDALLAAYSPAPSEANSFYSVAGPFVFDIPYWSHFVDVVIVGAGGGGGSGGILSGQGGEPGEWQAATFERGDSLPWETIAFHGVLGAGGQPDQSGDPTSVDAAGIPTMFANGGAAGAPEDGAPGTQYGRGPAPFTFNGRTYRGGADTAYVFPGPFWGLDGNAPGGGAHGGWLGQWAVKGGVGGAGGAFFRAY